MLKISAHEDDQKVRLQIEGALAGCWVKELEVTWRTARAALRGRSSWVDLTGATSGRHSESILAEADTQGWRSIPRVRASQAGPDFRNYGGGAVSEPDGFRPVVPAQPSEQAA